ncbi:ABC transporter ATP-binding protein [Paenibacillus sp. P26]|nr:ABC transporter ATP-binding protein [Paenibacillus sp. P26]
MHIVAKHLTKSFGDFQATKDVSFEIEKGKLIGLLGPSGGGKTTILRMLAGLEEPDSGEIWFDGRKVNDQPPQQRGIGFVFQNYALFRHMSVYDNIAFGLAVQKRTKAEIKARVQELMELTGLKGLEKRLPGQLSGDSVSAWHSPGRSLPSRGYCCSTSRSRRSTPRFARSSAPGSRR